MQIPEYLYHYTSIETLALILKNKTIRFNTLENVDDIDESQTNDLENFGRYTFVSCWTDLEEEQIPLWNLYTPNMQGVRIKLPIFPFKKRTFSPGELFNSEPVISYFDLASIFTENLFKVPPNALQLVEVKYVDDEDLLYPNIVNESYPGALQDILNIKAMEHIKKDGSVNLDSSKVGRYKRPAWKFQKEWRYLFLISPMGMQECVPPTFELQKEEMRRLIDPEYQLQKKDHYLEIDEEAFNQLEIVLGPKVTPAQKIIVEELVKNYAPSAKLLSSSLKIR